MSGSGTSSRLTPPPGATPPADRQAPDPPVLSPADATVLAPAPFPPAPAPSPSPAAPVARSAERVAGGGEGGEGDRAHHATPSPPAQQSPAAAPAEPRLGDLLVERGLLSYDQLAAALATQAEIARAFPIRLGEVLVRMGCVTEQQIRETLFTQGKEVRVCGACGLRFNVELETAARCPSCGAALHPAAAGAGVNVAESARPVRPGAEAAAATSPDTRARGRLGKFSLLNRIGQGGMGRVYKAFDGEMRRVVALKVLLEDTDPASTSAPAPVVPVLPPVALAAAAAPGTPEAAVGAPPPPAAHPAPADPATVQRFLREARTAGSLRHPHIVSVHEFGTTDGRHWFSMDYIEGGTLAAALRAAHAAGGPAPA
ncbi:MAG: hypothetical protein HZA54_12455, partial [Planctomycetes bacterium]|nr:hypothetical protein [Planctomycetota bacterium]